ncbi:hypothetical protein CJ030_MR1G002258 [Morella rubra]|uniref:Uncharacterized protein n=1 Tax=Morella rubra TaxID=262757 RepID=A0A6A1WTH5_9ROSI|nr:hypothetical protein CJ030_MR1G002258 [Morella rubra]
MSPPSLDIGGPSFELGGHSFEVGRSDKDIEAADVEAEHLTADGLLVTPPPSPDGKDDGFQVPRLHRMHHLLVGPPPSQSPQSTRSTRQTQGGPPIRDETPSQSTPITRATRKTQRGPQIRDATPSQSMPSTHSTRHTMQIPQLRDEESPSQSTGQPLSVPLTRSRRLSQLLSGIVEVNDNAVAAMTDVMPRAQTPYKEIPATESMETHPARKNTKGPSTRSTLAATGIASRIRMRRSSRLQRFRSQGASTSTKVVIDLTAPKQGKV